MVKTSKFCKVSLDGYKTILASASPRRKELLKEIVSDFEIIPSTVNEETIKSLSPSILVKKLARAKARDVKYNLHCNADGEEPKTRNANNSLYNNAVCADKICIIAADTLVYKRKILNKPADFVDALNMLMRLNGAWHSVYTGVCVIIDNKEISFVVKSRVKFKKLPRVEIEEYINKYSPYDKAGGYAIQDNVLVEKYTGSYSNIVGLPLERLAYIFKG